MPDRNTTDDVFRYTQIRPPKAASVGQTVAIAADSLAAGTLGPLGRAARTRAANELVKQQSAAALEALGSPVAKRLGEAIERILEKDGTVRQLRHVYAANDDASDLGALRKIYPAVEGFLTAAKFATAGVQTGTSEAARLFRAMGAVLDGDPAETDAVKLSAFLRRPIALPDQFRRPTDVLVGFPGGVAVSPPTVIDPCSEVRAHLDALDDLASVARTDLLVLPGSGLETAFTVSAAGVSRLAPETRALLDRLGLNPAVQPITSVLSALQAAMTAQAQRSARAAAPVQALALDAPLPPGVDPQQLPYLKSAGMADLLVLKQHLVRYERVDIAHIENVMQGEKRSRTHRALDRTEDITVSETETVRERETDLQTDERFELQRETNSTVKDDYQAGFQLSLSGRYGPAVEFSSNAQLDVHSSQEQTTRSATNYAKDIVSRSLERVTERVREQHQRNVMREIEETNLHEFNNTSSDHVIGCYQFIEKVYESQVFNYGQRTIFDFMIPEPASYVWFLEQSPATNLNLPEPPPKLAALAPNARYVNPCNYLDLAARFGAAGIAGPPPVLLTSSVSLKSGDGSASEEGQPRSIVDQAVPVPQGYRPFSATVRPLAMTDNKLTIGVTIGASQTVWAPRQPPETMDVTSGNTMAAGELQLYLGADSHPRDQQGSIAVQALAYETATFGLTVEVVFLRTQEAYEAWQSKTYDALAEAYRNALQKYDQDVAELKAKAQAEADRQKAAAPYGAPPAQNRRTVMEELKKQCISVITRQWFDQAGSVNDASPPTFDFDLAQQQGDFTRFFEQAFEWDQIQYVFYPYYWARQKTWADRFRRQDADPDFQEFLRAGAARVVAPVRPGFEFAVLHFLDTLQIWNGPGDPPDVYSPPYVPIITELRERADAPQGEIPVGDPWLTHVPTPLAVLRTDTKLPAWTRPDPQKWDWQEEP